MLKDSLKDSSLSLPLVFIVSYTPFWSNNWHMFAVSELLFSAALLLCVSAITFVAFHIIKKVFIKYFPIGAIEFKNTIVNIAYTALSLAFLVFLLKYLYPSYIIDIYYFSV